MPQTEKIRRNITLSKCHGQYVKDGEFYDFYAELNGRYSVEKATARLRREFEDYTILITNVEYVDMICEMPLDEFIAKSIIVKKENQK